MSTHNIFSKYNKICRIIPKMLIPADMEKKCKGPKNEFEIAVVNEPSVSESLKFYCI